MVRVYVTAVPLQGRSDLASNIYQSKEDRKPVRTRFPIVQVICNTAEEGDEVRVIAIRQMSSDTERNFGYLKEELEALHVGAQVTEIALPDGQDAKTLIGLCRDLTDAMPQVGRAYVCITYGTKTIPLVELAALTCAESTHKELEVGGVYYGEMKRTDGSATGCSLLHNMSALYHLYGIVGSVHDSSAAEALFRQLIWLSENGEG